MGRGVAAQGYFSPPGAKPTPCPVKLSLDGYGLHENLTLDCPGAYRITVPYRPVEQMAGQARREIAGQSGGSLEPSRQLEGVDERLRTVPVMVWFRTNGSFEMLTVEQGRRGQISVPFSSIQQVVRFERSSQA